VREVLNNVLLNPLAVDSLEGIERCLLLDEGVWRKVEETRKALEWLVRQKYLSKTMVAGGDPVFSLNPDNIAKAKEFLSTPDLLARKKKN
jgi:phosphoribosylanthranilate isomerase